VRLPRLALALPLSGLLVASVLSSTATADPRAERGAPGTWTRITTGDVANIAEPGLFRTADGVLHVLYLRENYSTDDLAFTNISSTGKVVGSGDAVTGWASLPQDPKVVAGPGGGMRLVFGGLQDTNTANPYSSGQMYSALTDAAGTSWTVQPGALTQSGYAYGSYGTGATTLADGVTPMVSFPLSSGLTWNAGGAPTDTTYDFGTCCTYHTSLAREGDATWSAFYANGSDDAHNGIFVKQLLPAVGQTVKAPLSTTGGDALDPGAAVPLATRSTGGVYAAYCVGYPTCTKIAVWRLGTAKPVLVRATGGAQEYSMSIGPGGRIWLAWSEANTDVLHATHTGTTGTTFGAVTTIKPPKGATVYGLTIAASDGSADVIVADGSALFHQQVLPGLTLKASPESWKKAKKQKVVLTVTDAGDHVKGAKVTVGGRSCTTKASGSCSITFTPSTKKHRFWATARASGYGAAKVRLTQQ
jgi:hypothetical protein